MAIRTRAEMALELGLDRVLAPPGPSSSIATASETPASTHSKVMIEDWHGDHPFVLNEIFRNGAKSTIAEEALLIQAGFREFRNALVICETQDRANDRVEAIKHEAETNEWIAEIFENDLSPGDRWAAGELVFANGVRVLGLGRGASIRGIKFHESRPDRLFIDDLEDEDSTRDPKRRKATKTWFTRPLILRPRDPEVKVCMAATPLDPDDMAEMLRRDPTSC